MELSIPRVCASIYTECVLTTPACIFSREGTLSDLEEQLNAKTEEQDRLAAEVRGVGCGITMFSGKTVMWCRSTVKASPHGGFSQESNLFQRICPSIDIV